MEYNFSPEVVSLNVDLVSEFLKQGFLGVLLVTALIAIFRLTTKYDQVQEKRISEGLANQKIIADLTQAIRDLAQVQRTHR